jgi:uncharacterized protein (TIGR00251 family)
MERLSLRNAVRVPTLVGFLIRLEKYPTEVGTLTPRFTIHDSRFTISAPVIRYSQDGRTLTFAVRVAPRASRSEISGEHDGALRVRIAAPPVEGAANRELIKVIARAFKVPQSAVEIIAGTNSKSKTVRVHGVDVLTLERLIQSQ